ncbi:hypothetical protein DFH09DRAFT_1101763 [Mycena vulgaris]|nr:hypothetical protein DFH09DRAFT_1101763 [Mycena vulgaris]
MGAGGAARGADGFEGRCGDSGGEGNGWRPELVSEAVPADIAQLAAQLDAGYSNPVQEEAEHETPAIHLAVRPRYQQFSPKRLPINGLEGFAETAVVRGMDGGLMYLPIAFAHSTPGMGRLHGSKTADFTLAKYSQFFPPSIPPADAPSNFLFGNPRRRGARREGAFCGWSPTFLVDLRGTWETHFSPKPRPERVPRSCNSSPAVPALSRLGRFTPDSTGTLGPGSSNMNDTPQIFSRF